MTVDFKRKGGEKLKKKAKGKGKEKVKSPKSVSETEMNSSARDNVSAIAVFGLVGAILGAIAPVFGANTPVLGFLVGIVIGFFFDRCDDRAELTSAFLLKHKRPQRH